MKRLCYLLPILFIAAFYQGFRKPDNDTERELSLYAMLLFAMVFILLVMADLTDSGVIE